VRASHLAGLLDSGVHEARLFAWLAVALIVVRTITFVVVEGIVFNSDEALYGLMAKHLSEFRAFPLFSYGEGYQMAVEAWLIAPFFWLLGPSVLAMKIPLVLLNIAVALTLMRLITRWLQLRPALAFVAVLPFIMPTPVVAASLMQNSGSATGPLLYIPALWVLRGRPFAFGALLMFGYLHREFTLYALPALMLVRGLIRPWWTAARGRRLAWVAGGAALVWGIADLVQRLTAGTSAAVQGEMLMNHTCLVPAEWPSRLGYALTSVVPVFTGGVSTPFYDFSIRSAVVTGGFASLAWGLAGVITIMLVRLVWIWRRAARPASLGVFLALVGCVAVLAYPFGCNLEVGAPPVLRYLHLLLFVPVGLVAAFLARERAFALRAAVVIAFLMWSGVNLADNARVIWTAYRAPDANPHRALADFLVEHDIRRARANFWDAYAVTFLTGERVIVDSRGPVRIPAYTDLVDAAGKAAAEIRRMPCHGAATVAGIWCVDAPGLGKVQQP